MDEIEKKFRCKNCGYCCEGETTVALSDDDIRLIGEHLGLSPEELAEKYLDHKPGRVQMKTRSGRCVFYDKGCLIHPAKPYSCRIWPFFPVIWKDADNFEIIKKSCPGLQEAIAGDKR